MTYSNVKNLFSGALFMFLASLANGFRCERKVLGFSQDFNCPQYGDPSDAVFCCGSKYNRYCCSTRLTIDIGMLVGTIMAGFFLIVFAILAVCCCMRRSRHSAGVPTAYTVPSATTVITTSAPAYPATPYGAPPPGYTTQSYQNQNQYPQATAYPYPTQQAPSYPRQAMPPYKDAPPNYPGY